MHQVIVAGGGPAGLAAAIAARQAGLDVSVFDCARPPIDKACGEGIMPDGLAALQRLGVTIPPELACTFRGIRFLDELHSVEATFANGTGYGVRRVVLHDLLADHAAALGVKLHWERESRVSSATQSRWTAVESPFAGWCVLTARIHCCAARAASFLPPPNSSAMDFAAITK